MKKIIKLTERDLTKIVKRVIKESDVKDTLIDMVKEDGWESAAELVGGIENLKKLTGIETPIDFLNIFTDLDVVQSEEYPDWTLFRRQLGQNLMIYTRDIDKVYINQDEIWSVLENGFGLNESEIQEITQEWLSDVYNLRGIKTLFLRNGGSVNVL